MASATLKSTGILIHGCHIEAIGWKEIVYGNIDGRLGRVPTAIEEAVHRHAQLIFWGTGASEKKGLKESEYTFKKAIGSKLEFLATLVEKKPGDLEKYLKQVSVIDSSSQNTKEEINSAVKKCLEMGIKKLILVSSPTHIARCLQLSCQIKAQKPFLFIKFYALASQISFFRLTLEGAKVELDPASVTIFEPPHRGDMPKVDLNIIVKGIFSLFKNEELAKAFNEELKVLIKKYENQKLLNYA